MNGPSTPHGDRFDDPEATITLNEALKLSGLAETGGQAKLMIQSGQVRVNGEVETRRKRRLREGDVIAVGDQEFVLELSGGES
jgi:ribosome-associated protein